MSRAPDSAGGRAGRGLRLGVYSDLVYRRDGDVLSTRRAFIRFVTALAPHVEELVLFGRLDPQPGRFDYELPARHVRLAPLPHYENARRLFQMARAMRGSLRAFRAELPGLDAVWVFGPQPLAIAFALVARRRGVPVVLGVRQDYPAYIEGRLPSRRWAWAVPVARLLDGAFRRLGRRSPAIVLGHELELAWSGGAPVLNTGFSLVTAADIRSPDAALAAGWDDDIRILSVGRLDAEKNPMLLLDVLAELRSTDPRWRMTIAGDGPLRATLEARATELGLGDAARFAGEVPNGPELWGLYRSCDVFLHVSFTEGLPQVLFEAQAAGLPLVATAVGGVAAALGDGEAGLLIPPADRDAAVHALRRLADDADLREHLVRAGHASVRNETLEAQAERVVRFIEAAAQGPGA